MLWGRSGNKCAICKTDLAEDISESDDYSILGEEAHIVAKEENGPRGKSSLSYEQRDKYSNLLLLCQKHHKIIDDHEDQYSVDKLLEIKEDHIKWVKSSLKPDEEKQKDDEIYATYVEEFIKMADIDNWDDWSSYVLSSGHPQIFKDQFENLHKLNEYLLSRIWPKRYQDLEFSFHNFRLVLNDFLRVLSKHLDMLDNERYCTKRFYKSKNEDLLQEEYDLLLKKYNYHVNLVEDLMCELTRSANFVIVNIKYYLSSSFRIKEGLLLITTGPGIDLRWTTIRLEYASKSLDDIQYKGLKNFMTSREDVFHFGSGVSEDYFWGEWRQ